MFNLENSRANWTLSNFVVQTNSYLRSVKIEKKEQIAFLKSSKNFVGIFYFP